MYFTELFQRLRARERKRGFLCQTWFTALRSVLVLNPEKALGRLSHRRIVICREAGSSSSCWARLLFPSANLAFVGSTVSSWNIRLEEAPASGQFRIGIISTYFGVIQRSKGGGENAGIPVEYPSGLYIYKSSGSINFSYLRKHIYIKPQRR